MSATLTDIGNKIDGSQFFHELREERPVYFDPGYQMYIVSRHEDAVAVLKQATVFSSAKAIFSSYNYEDIVNEILNETAHGPLVPVLPMTDPPEHTRVRSMVNLAFSAPRVAKIRDFIESLTEELVGKLLEKPEVEIVEELAKPLPVTVIGDLLCLPRERWRDVIRWTTAYSSCAGNLLRDENHARQIGHDLAEMQNFIVDHLNERRENPGDDVLTDLLNARAGDYQPLSEREILAVAAAFVGAGHETTTVAITELVRLLAERPDLVEQLRQAEDQPTMIKSFCEEFLRLNPPLNAQPRVATEDTEIAGVKIPAGTPVLVANRSANRDERVFGEDAAQFSCPRKGVARHITFGGGVHACLGNALARAELQCVTAAIVNHMDDLHLLDEEIPQSDYGPAIMDWNYHIKRLRVGFSARQD